MNPYRYKVDLESVTDPQWAEAEINRQMRLNEFLHGQLATSNQKLMELRKIGEAILHGGHFDLSDDCNCKELLERALQQ